MELAMEWGSKWAQLIWRIRWERFWISNSCEQKSTKKELEVKVEEIKFKAYESEQFLEREETGLGGLDQGREKGNIKNGGKEER